MLHGLPKRPVMSLPQIQRPSPSTSASSSAARAQPTATQQAHQPAPAPPYHTIPPPIDSSASVLLSQIPLPENPLICYTQFGPVDGVRDRNLAVELMRRSLVQEWEEKGILDTWLAIVRTENQFISLWVFTVGSDGGNSASPLDSLHLDEMHGEYHPPSTTGEEYH